MAAATNAVVASGVVLVPGVAVGAVGVPINAGDAKGATDAAFAAVKPSVLLMSVAVATAVMPSDVRFMTPLPPGSDRPELDATTAAVTKAVVASCIVLVPGDAVGAVGVPVNAGLANGAAPVTCPTL